MFEKVQVSNFNVLRNLNLLSQEHFDGIVLENIFHYVFANQLEKNNIAKIYFLDKQGYQLQDNSGILIQISSKQNKVEVTLKSYSDSQKLQFNIESQQCFQKSISIIESMLTQLNTETHRLLMLKRMENMVKKFEFDVLNGKVDAAKIIFREAIDSYGVAIKNLIESDQLFQLTYFKRSKRFSSDVLPKILFSLERLVDKDKKLGTTINCPVKVALNQIKRFADSETYKATSWGMYSSENKAQYCISDYIVSKYSVDLGEKSFFMDRRKEKVSGIIGFPSINKLEKLLKITGQIDTVCLYPDDLSSFIFVLAKIKSLNHYYRAKDGGSMSALIEIGNHCFVLNVEAAYYSFRDLLNYSIKNKDVVSIELSSDKIILSNTSSLQFALTAKKVSPEEVNDVELMHEYNCLFKPLNLLSLTNSQKEKRAAPKTETINRIETFVDSLGA